MNSLSASKQAIVLSVKAHACMMDALEGKLRLPFVWVLVESHSLTRFQRHEEAEVEEAFGVSSRWVCGREIHGYRPFLFERGCPGWQDEASLGGWSRRDQIKKKYPILIKIVVRARYRWRARCPHPRSSISSSLDFDYWSGVPQRVD